MSKFVVQIYTFLMKNVKKYIMSIVKKREGQLVSVTQKKSVLQDPSFQSVKGIAETWLKSQPDKSLGRQMDSVIFNEDRFELIVDTRGYRPEDLKCTVGPNSIEVVAEREEVSAGTQRHMSTARNYQLPQQVLPQRAICCLSSEGILLIAVPWQK